jgi:hypothetical protein
MFSQRYLAAESRADGPQRYQAEGPDARPEGCPDQEAGDSLPCLGAKQGSNLSFVFRLRNGSRITACSPKGLTTLLRSCLVQDDAAAAPASTAGLGVVVQPVSMEESDTQESSGDPPATPSIPGSGNFPFPLFAQVWQI